MENLDGVDIRRREAYSADGLKGTVTDYNQYKELAYRDTELDLIGDTEILNLIENMWREYERTELPMTDLCTSVLNQFIPLDEQKIHASLRDKTSSLQLSLITFTSTKIQSMDSKGKNFAFK